MRYLLGILVFLSSCRSLDVDEPAQIPVNPIRVAVIDTGLDKDYWKDAHLCPTGHKDFTGEGMHDVHGHGTNVTGLIVKNAGRSNNYCIIVIKAYGYESFMPQEFLTEALEYARIQKVDIVHLSSGGILPEEDEMITVGLLLNDKITLVTAAGNNRHDLDEKCQFFPACYYPEIIVVGATEEYSNYGSIVDVKFPGRNQRAFGKMFTGTSQAAAVFTGNFLKSIDKRKREK